ncbi:hypothetical protein [Psychrobacter sp. C 20.9]|nr:hypothetical protein [Psychrobacter sp. C 20.9]
MANGYRPEIVQRAFVDFIGSRLHPFWSLTDDTQATPYCSIRDK